MMSTARQFDAGRSGDARSPARPLAAPATPFILRQVGRAPRRPATEGSAMSPEIGRVLRRGGLIAALAASPLAGAAASQTVDTIRANGVLTCGVSTGVAGFSMPDTQGNWAGFDVDMCRA